MDRAKAGAAAVLRDLNEIVAVAELEALTALAAAVSAAAAHAACRALELQERRRTDQSKADLEPEGGA